MKLQHFCNQKHNHKITPAKEKKPYKNAKLGGIDR